MEDRDRAFMKAMAERCRLQGMSIGQDSLPPRTGNLEADPQALFGVLTATYVGHALTAIADYVASDGIFLAVPGPAGLRKIGWWRGEDVAYAQLPRWGGFTKRVLATRTAILRNGVRSSHVYQLGTDGWNENKPQHYAGVPTVVAGSWAAVAALRAPTSPEFEEEDLSRLQIAASHLSLLCDNAIQFHEVAREAITDALTQAYNYRFLRRAVSRTIERAANLGESFSLLMADVDNLKVYNGRHGHLMGSALLKVMAGVFIARVRSSDLVTKYGGDEFVIILPRTKKPGALALARRLRRTIARTPFPHAKAGEISCSFGVSCYPEDGENFEELVGAADMALFRAKAQGRGAVVGFASGEAREDWLRAAA